MFALALMALVALVPPGFCACHLTALLICVEDSMPEHSDSTDDGDDHDSRTCESLIPDAVAPPSPAFLDGAFNVGVVTSFGAIAEVLDFAERSFVDAPPPTDPPLYLTLRAFLI